MKAIRLIGETHYQETSLSQLLAYQETSKQNEKTQTLFREESNKVSMDHSLQFSQSRISKQFSQKYSEYQSNYVSQISKLKADSVNIPNSKQKDSHSFDQIINIFYQDEENKQQKRLNYQTTPSQSKYQLPHFPKTAINNILGFPIFLFTLFISTKYTIFVFLQCQLLLYTIIKLNYFIITKRISVQLRVIIFLYNNSANGNTLLNDPRDITYIIQSLPRFWNRSSIPCLNTSLLYQLKSTERCCSRVLIADCEYQNIQILEMILSRFKVNSQRAFSTEDVIKLFETKKMFMWQYWICFVFYKCGFTKKRRFMVKQIHQGQNDLKRIYNWNNRTY
ncbi:unnamed protein product [Paramecium sonneborni]|uniref:Transmembrane protein n=1 Tax=Paramecium sonneborni TaxID=65129 RepID=A0A8S1RQ01_9CILI|nr:unnamed protein product [Paramecium sonneborni]